MQLEEETLSWSISSVWTATETITKNIMLIFSVLALAAECRAYHVYYYYDDIRSHINEMTLLPNMVLAGESVFLCNKERSECMILYKKCSSGIFAGSITI